MRRAGVAIVVAAATAALVIACADGPTAPSGVITGPTTNILEVQQDAISDDAYYLQYLETGEAGPIVYTDLDDDDLPDHPCSNSAPGGGSRGASSDCSGTTPVTGQTQARLNCQARGSCYSWRNSSCVRTCGSYQSPCQNGGVPPNCR